MAEDPFGRDGEDDNPFGATPGDPLNAGGWAPPTPPPPPGEAPPPPPEPLPSWAPPTPGGGAVGPVAGTATPTNGKATAALVLGILGLPFFLPVLCSIPALVLGYQARGEIQRSAGRQGGLGNAKAGIIMGWIGTTIGVAFILLMIVLAATGSFDDPSSSSDENFAMVSELLRAPRPTG